MKQTPFLPRIPRPVKACVCALGVVILAVVYYIVLGCPTFTFKQEFRRAEQAHLVGPSVIVDTLKEEYREFDRMIVGETEHGVCFFGRYGTNYSNGKHRGTRMYAFTYLEKTGAVTLAAAPNILGSFWDMTSVSLPVYLFAEDPDAVRAEIAVTVSGTYKVYENNQAVSADYLETFYGTADRTKNGIFRFFFTGKEDAACQALDVFSTVSSGSMLTSPEATKAQITATVRLYDGKGELICTEILDLSRSQ